MRVTMEKDPASHGGEGIRVKGCKNDGGSVNEECNGLYTCMPPYNNINGGKHYAVSYTHLTLPTIHLV